MRHEIGDALQHAAWFENEGRQRDSREVGAGTELRDDVGEDISLLRGHDSLVAAILGVAVLGAVGFGGRAVHGARRRVLAVAAEHHVGAE